MADIAADTAALLMLAFEWGLYGLSLLMFGATLVVLWSNKTSRRTCLITHGISVSFFVLGTVHAILDLLRVNQGLVNARDAPGGPVAFFRDSTRIYFVPRIIVFLLQTLLGDAVVIYRCYVVWDSYYIIIFPIMLWLSFAVSGFGQVYYLLNGSQRLIISVKGWITAASISSFATNVVSTGLLAFKIWQIEKESSKFRANDSGLRTLLRIVIDSGALYTASVLAVLIVFLHGSIVNVVDLVVPIISISFYAIIIRLNLARRAQKEKESTLSPCAFHWDDIRLPQGPLQVHVSSFAQPASNFKTRDSPASLKYPAETY